MAGVIISRFENALSQVLALTFFLPIVMDMGGNVGTQSTTIFTRSLVLGHIRPNEFLKPLINEVTRGLTIGAIVGSLTGVIASIWQASFQLGLVVGLAILCTVTLGSALGYFVPWLLFKLKLDQAAGAGPILTTVKDITGLLIYFYLATLFMGLVA